ncbi:MAG: hypothetical protein PHQ59_00550 [Candidatus Daviesbacteria bacterium]|nr:hypothetical protein [Candidatus Daviesbacteria bacterium]
MKFFTRRVTLIIVIAGLLLTLIIINQVKVVRVAHETFENYYAFRGCTELLQKGDDFGICKVKTGQTIKIVKFENKWYLDGDLPCGSFLCI